MLRLTPYGDSLGTKDSLSNADRIQQLVAALFGVESLEGIGCYPDLGKLAGGRYAFCTSENRALWLASLA